MSSNSFLQKIAQTIISNYSNKLDEIIIVLPNKRAKVFLIESFKKELTQTVFCPEIISIEEFVQDLSGIRAIDTIELLFSFYDVYLGLTPKNNLQSFEQFSNWAKTLLQDFNEIDRYLIDTNHVFSYLKEIEVLKRWDLQPTRKTELINKQLDFWDKLPLYYEKLHDFLLQKNIGYQGLIYRQAVNNLEVYGAQLNSEKVIFAGFNALNQAEEKIIQHLLSLDRAEVFWDIDKVFLNDYHHDAGLFIRRFKKNWIHYKSNPFDWIVDEFSSEKNIEIIGTSKSIGQAKIVSDIIINEKKKNVDLLDKVALVLGDENLLIPILFSLPEDVEALNVTMGYSAKNNPIQQLIAKLFKLHSHAISRNPESYVFYYKDVLDILTNPIVEVYLNCGSAINLIKKNNFTFITHSKLISLSNTSDELFELLFQKWNASPFEIAKRINVILLHIKSLLDNSNDSDKVIKTFLHSIYKVINKLITYCENNEFVDSISVLYSIYKQIVDLAEVSFEGEPLSGLQIMGVLESRVLDFETVIITSMNEGKFPAGKSVNSFIPHDVKREIGLPTFKEKDAIYTYHFYHLLLRAKNIYLLYNTENEGLDGGEKSRFITQLEVEKQPNHIVTHSILQPDIPNIAYEKVVIEKSEFVLERLKEIATVKGFSPSALTAYIRNPIQFYFQRILSIREADEVEENIALNTLGTIIHKTLEVLYMPYLNKFLSIEDIDNMISLVDKEVLNQFKEIYKEGEVTKGKNLLAFEVAKRNILNFLKQERKNIETGDVVKILKLETALEEWIEDISLPYPVKIAGNVDRIEIRNNTFRIIDYKTGKVEQNNLKITSFQGLTLDVKNEKIIQLLCYAFMFQKELNGMPLEVGVVSFKNMKAGFIPFQFQLDKEKQVIISDEILQNFRLVLVGLINEVLNAEISFKEVDSNSY